MFPHTTRLLQWFTPSLLLTPAFTTWAISVTPLSASSPLDIIFLWRGEWIRIWFFFHIYREGSSRDEEDSLPWCSMVVTIWVCFSITFVILSLFHCLCINSFNGSSTDDTAMVTKNNSNNLSEEQKVGLQARLREYEATLSLSPKDPAALEVSYDVWQNIAMLYYDAFYVEIFKELQ